MLHGFFCVVIKGKHAFVTVNLKSVKKKRFLKESIVCFQTRYHCVERIREIRIQLIQIIDRINRFKKIRRLINACFLFTAFLLQHYWMNYSTINEAAENSLTCL